MSKKIYFLLTSTLLMNESLAAPKLSPTGNLGLSFGGEKLQTIQLRNNRGETTTESIYSGERAYLNIGALYSLSNTYKLQSTLGWHTDQVQASNADAGFSRFPIEVTAFYYPNTTQRIGIGVSHHLNPVLRLPENDDIQFDNATGMIIQYDIANEYQLFFGIRYVSLDYQLSDSHLSFDGSYIGFHIGEGF